MLDQISNHISRSRFPFFEQDESLSTLTKSISVHFWTLVISVIFFSRAETKKQDSVHYLFRYNNSVCCFLTPLFHRQIVNFSTAKNSTPTVIVSACYLNQVPQQNSIATWVEVCRCWQSSQAASASHSNHR